MLTPPIFARPRRQPDIFLFTVARMLAYPTFHARRRITVPMTTKKNSSHSAAKFVDQTFSPGFRFSSPRLPLLSPSFSSRRPRTPAPNQPPRIVDCCRWSPSQSPGDTFFRPTFPTTNVGGVGGDGGWVYTSLAPLYDV